MTFASSTFDEDELDDFDSADFEDVADNDHNYLKGMWGGFSKSSIGTDMAKDTVLAHGMVQSFVNAFARDGRYVVVFDPNTSTAGTDMKSKFVAITPGPIADLNLTAEEAGVILTGLAVHEISHPRYGRMTSQAVEKVFPRNNTAQRLSNLLDDIRIERRFVADYPGYAGIFTPVLDYVGKAGAPKDGSLKKRTLKAPVNLAIAATRYAKFSDWSDPAIKAEFDWWNDWALRGAREDAPKRHVDFIREALQHIADLKTKMLATPTPQNGTPAPITPPPGTPQQGGDDDGEGNPTPGEGDGQGEDDDDIPQDPKSAARGQGSGQQPMSDTELNEATRPTHSWDPKAGEDETDPMNSCSGSESVEDAAEEGDTTKAKINALKNSADAIIEAARNEESDGHGNVVDVNKSLRGLGGGKRATPSAIAAKYIRNAIMQSRTGHTDHEPFKRHGRLDQRGIARIAQGDFRLFEKRTAPSVGRYNIWVMVDSSSSMEWGRGYSSPLQEAAGVGHAMAVASQTIPTVRMSLWAWTTPFRYGAISARGGAALAWRTGMNPDQALRLSTVSTGGTPDATIMGWAARAILKETVGEEIPVIIFISDGAGDSEMNDRINEARRMGVEVYGVSFSGGMQAVDEARFGKANVVPWKGSIEETARPLAKLFARITGGTR